MAISSRLRIVRQEIRKSSLVMLVCFNTLIAMFSLKTLPLIKVLSPIDFPFGTSFDISCPYFCHHRTSNNNISELHHILCYIKEWNKVAYYCLL